MTKDEQKTIDKQTDALQELIGKKQAQIEESIQKEAQLVRQQTELKAERTALGMEIHALGGILQSLYELEEYKPNDE